MVLVWRAWEMRASQITAMTIITDALNSKYHCWVKHMPCRSPTFMTCTNLALLFKSNNGKHICDCHLRRHLISLPHWRTHASEKISEHEKLVKHYTDWQTNNTNLGSTTCVSIVLLGNKKPIIVTASVMVSIMDIYEARFIRTSPRESRSISN